MTGVTNEEELNLIEKALIKKKYSNIDTSSNEVEGEEQELVTKAIEKKNKEQGFFNKSIDFISDFFTGNNREEFSKMGELSNAPLTNIGNAIKLGTAFAITPSVEAQIDMVKNVYPEAVISRDKFENVVITLPEGSVKKGTDRTFYLNKPGFTFKDAVEGVAQVLQYIPGAGFVYKKVGGGIIKLATRRYYGFDQTTGIGNAGFTRMDKAFVTITPSSASNYIRLGGVMNWSGSDTENQYSFRWRREISGGATTSLDASVGSGLRPGIQFRLLGNGDVATLQLQGVIDYPNTTSAVTYYIEAFVDGANQSVYLNRGQNDSNDPRYERAASYFTAEEIDNSIHTHTNTNS